MKLYEFVITLLVVSVCFAICGVATLGLSQSSTDSDSYLSKRATKFDDSGFDILWCIPFFVAMFISLFTGIFAPKLWNDGDSQK